MGANGANGNLRAMNLIALLAGLLPWAATPVSAFTRIYLACSLLSLEAQVITWRGRGSLGSLVFLNVALAACMAAWQVRAKRPTGAWMGRTWRLLPVPVVLALLAIVVALNVWRPVEAADAYQLDRVLQIEHVGTLAYSADIDPKANIVGAFYELMLADLQGVPLVGASLVRLHGVWGLLVFTLAFAAAQTWLPLGRSAWALALLFTVPVVFHQLVMIKNDLFLGAPAFVALAWAVGSTGRANLKEAWWAGWLVGLVVAAKLTNAAVALVIGVSVLLRDRTWRPLILTAAGVLAGIIAGGLALTLWQNTRFYGDPLATRQVEAIGSLNRSIGAALVGITRFLISFFDLSLLTRVMWPGRGGWGGTFGLPFMWALAVLVASWRSLPEARRAIIAGGVCLLALGITFPDADLSHRLALGPGLMVIAAGASASRTLEQRWVSRTLIITVVLSAVQLLRSALLYATRA